MSAPPLGAEWMCSCCIFWKMTDRRSFESVYRFLYIDHARVPDPVGLFLRDGNRVSVDEQDEDEDARRKGQSRRGAGLQARRALRQADFDDPDRQQYRQYRAGIHRHGAVYARAGRYRRDGFDRRDHRGGSDLWRNFAEKHRQGLCRAVCLLLRADHSGDHLVLYAADRGIFAVEKAAE